MRKKVLNQFRMNIRKHPQNIKTLTTKKRNEN